MASIHIHARIDINHFATLLKYMTEKQNLCLSTKAAIISDSMSMLVDILEKMGEIVPSNDLEQSIQYIVSRGLSIDGVSRRVLGKELSSSTRALPSIDIPNKTEVIQQVLDSIEKGGNNE